MVLASNEWLNNCEDDQRSTTTTTGNTPAATTATTNTAATGNRGNALTSGATQQVAGTTTTTTQTATNTNNTTIVALAPSTSISITTTTRTTSANNEIMSENPNSEIQQQLEQQQLKSGIISEGLSITTTTTAVAELNGPHEIVNNNSEVLNCDTSNTTNTENANSSIGDNVGIDGNNSSNANAADEVSTLNNTNNANLYSNPNSNASTLQSALGRQKQGHAASITVASLIPLSSPITPQALSNALQSVMNASNNTPNVTVNTSTVSNIQNHFLSTLGVDISNGGGNGCQLAKELSAAYCSGLVEPQQTNLSNNTNVLVQNVVSTSNLSMNLEGVDNNGQAKIMLICESNSHPFQTRTIQLTPNIECKVGRLIAKSKASETNAIFDCKVLSRNHAVLWYTDDGKFWVKDTKSSNGTFINENKLGTEAAELHFGDIVKFGVDVLENSRKEVHGCIIAFVKLYMPDGREAISIDTTTQRSQYSGEGRISYEEMHRLNLYMQEVSQREKALKSKLFNIQNVLDATRKNSALCWQSLIAEDQLLHRINSLEKKLQVMEKNVPESVLRNEVLKLLEDKNSYQLTAKEALRKVYQERCDALQMLSKMELAYANSDGECKILRDQIMSTKQSLQDVNTRLQRLETDYNEYKEDAERKQQEIKEQEEQRIAEMTEKLQQRELECDDLRRRVSEFMLQRAELIDEEEKKLELQAIEKLDAVIGDMDLGEDDDDDEDEEDDENGGDANNDVKAKGDEGDGEHKEDGNEKDLNKKLRQPRATKSLGALNGDGRKSLNSSDEIEILNISPETEAAQKRMKKKGDPKESTILKWLQNSDLNKKEGSIDIFKAICGESDSSDEQDMPMNENSAALDSESGIDTNTTSAEEIKVKYKKSKNKLQSVQTILCQLVEAELTKECYKTEVGADEIEHNKDEENEAKRNENESISTNAMNDKHKLQLLQRSVAMLSEAYKEISETLNEHESMKAAAFLADQQDGTTISLQQQLQNYVAFNTSGGSATSKKLTTQDTLMPLVEAVEEESTQLLEGDETHSEECTTTATTPSTIVSASIVAVEELKLRDEVNAYQAQVKQLNLKLEQVESDAQNTLEIMQIECDTFREKVEQLTKVLQKACEEKQEFKRLLDERADADIQQQQQVSAELAKPAAHAEQKTNAEKEVEATKVPPLQSNTHVDVLPEVLTHFNEDKESSDVYNSNSASLLLQQSTASTNSTSGIGMLLLDTDDFEAQLCDDLAAIGNTALQREEELIAYKERLEKTQNDNLQLRNEIAALLHKTGTQAQTQMMKQMLAYGTVVAAIIIYVITMYF